MMNTKFEKKKSRDFWVPVLPGESLNSVASEKVAVTLQRITTAVLSRPVSSDTLFLPAEDVS